MQYARERQNNEKVERNSAHAPGVAVADRIAVDLGWMQVQEHVREHAQRPVARGVVVFMAEDRGVDLGLGRILEVLDLLFGFRGQIGSQRVDVLSDSAFHALQQSDSLAVFCVLIFFSHPTPLPIPTIVTASRSGLGLHSRGRLFLRVLGLHRQECSRIVEVARLPLGPAV